jgi:hypothetical protein
VAVALIEFKGCGTRLWIAPAPGMTAARQNAVALHLNV